MKMIVVIAIATLVIWLVAFAFNVLLIKLAVLL